MPPEFLGSVCSD